VKDRVAKIIPVPPTVRAKDCWRYSWSMSLRGGTIEFGYIVNTEGKHLLDTLISRNYVSHLGEVLGKHSEVSINLGTDTRGKWQITEEWHEDVNAFGYRHEYGVDPLGEIIDRARDDIGTSAIAMRTDGDRNLTMDALLAWIAQ
jgi:hypothetical protein